MVKARGTRFEDTATDQSVNEAVVFFDFDPDTGLSRRAQERRFGMGQGNEEMEQDAANGRNGGHRWDCRERGPALFAMIIAIIDSPTRLFHSLFFISTVSEKHFNVHSMGH